MAKRSPAFSFYPGDWLGSPRVAALNLAQAGAYMHLLAFAWLDPDCSLPDDSEALARLSRMGSDWPGVNEAAIRRLFVPHPLIPGRLINERLTEEREKQLHRAEAGQKGGVSSGQTRSKREANRKQRRSKREAGDPPSPPTPPPPPCETSASTPSSFSSASESAPSASTADCAAHTLRDADASLGVRDADEERFERFWAAYPARDGKKRGRSSALAKFMRLRPGEQEEAIEAAGNYSRSGTVARGYAKDPHRFFEGGFWRDYKTPETEVGALDDRTRRAASSIDQATQILMGAIREGE